MGHCLRPTIWIPKHLKSELQKAWYSMFSAEGIWNPEAQQFEIWTNGCKFFFKPFEIWTIMSSFWMVQFSNGWYHGYCYSHSPTLWKLDRLKIDLQKVRILKGQISDPHRLLIKLLVCWAQRRRTKIVPPASAVPVSTGQKQNRVQPHFKHHQRTCLVRTKIGRKW